MGDTSHTISFFRVDDLVKDPIVEETVFLNDFYCNTHFNENRAECCVASHKLASNFIEDHRKKRQNWRQKYTVCVAVWSVADIYGIRGLLTNIVSTTQ